MTQMEVLLLGDQTANQYPQLRKACLQKNNVLVATFFEHAGLALREETRKLPRRKRELIPDFLTILTLVENYHATSTKVPELESSLVTLSQLAHYIGYYEENPQEFPVLANTRAIGLCTGLISAVAIASARCLSELIPLAVEAVRTSFRVGSHVGAARDLLDNSNAQDSWSTIVTGITEETANLALGEFRSSSMIDASRQAYVSAVSTAAVTISGPPSTVKRLFAESDVFNKSNRVPIPIYAPYHARHLFSDLEIDSVIDEKSKGLFRQFEPRGLVHSTVTGKCHRSKDTLELMRAVLHEILLEPVRWDRLLDEIITASSMNVAGCTVTALGITNVVNSLVCALKVGGQHSVEVRDHTSWPTTTCEDTGRTQHDKIAIVGMSGRFPSAANHEALWDLLMKGLDVHREVPKDRFDAQAHCDPSGKGRNKSHTPYGCFIDEPGLFDPRFFNMSPREAAQTDPMGRLALVTAYEALEMSGYVPNRTPSTKLHRIGTFYGQTSDDWREINAAENVDTYFITGGVRAFAPGRINYFFKFSGPSFSIDTACSSSLAAIQLACTSLWAGDCDTACAGGLNVLTNPDIFSGLSKGQFLSKTGSCKTYDNDADGYCRGDGCGSIILKRYQDAIMDNDNILGCILGAGTNHSAEAVSITHPHAGAQEFLYKKVLADAGVDAHDITYVEMHGTGTQAGDGIEMTSVTNVFAPPHRRRLPEQPLYLGAVKANIGHGEAASGINSMIKVLMMMRKNKIPANVGIKGVMNKSFPKDLGERNVHIPVKAIDMPRHGAEKRRIFLNNFSAAGGNTAVLLEDGPLREAPFAKDPRSTHVITVSARAISSLNRNIQNLVGYLDAHPNTELPSLSYTTTARRLQHNYRVAFTASSMSQVREALLGQMKETYSPIALVPTVPAFAFTGQGSQYTGLGQQLYEDLKSFRADIDQLDNVCRVQSLPSFLPLITGTDVSTLSPVVVQLGMACIQVALARMWASWGVRPCAVIGHSLGEYAALHVAGVISASDMIYLVGQRAEILVRTCTQSTHGMLAVKASEDSIAELLGNNMTEVACRNAPEETVLCGKVTEMEGTQLALDAQGVKSTMLKVPFAFHSSQVQPILEAFKEAAATVVYNKPTVPVLSPLLGEVIREVGVIGPDYLARHARETLDFWSGVSAGQSEKVFGEKTPWLEIGAHPVCSGMVRACVTGNVVAAPSLRRNEDPWKTLSTTICTLYSTGVALNFDEYHREFNDAHELLTLPTYSFDNKNYWLEYHNNWTLTKGLLPAPAKVEPVVEKKSKLSTTSCQRIVFEELHANSGTVIVQSDLAEPKLSIAVSGHLVNGAPLCPSSLYADMALTVTDYLYKQLRPGAPQVGLNVCKMEVPKPLIAKLPPPPEGQHIQIEASADLETGQAILKYRSVTPEGKLIQDHAHCIVKFESIDDWYESWNMTKYMVQTQIDMLKQKLSTGAAHKVLRGVAYKLFKALVNYDDKYRGMEEVILDGKETEATAQISFQADEKDGNFFCSPYWIDSLCHITGFICNGTDLIDSDLNVFISHGWGSMRFARPFSPEKKYRSYVRMQPQPNNVRAGDVYIFEDEELVGVVGGIKFQQIPRRVMDIMLPPVKARSAPPAKAPLVVPVIKAAPRPTINSPKSPKAVIKPSMPKAAVPKTSRQSMTSKVMNIIASETDVNMSELVDDAAFENLGVDSLMSLTISAKFREELELEIPSALFTERPTVGSMKAYFAQFDGAPPPTTDSDTEPDDSSDGTPYDDGASTPPSSPPSVSDYDEKFDDMPVKKPSAVVEGQASVARLIIAQEMGVPASEISDKADLAEMGMDSLMSLTVLSALREQTGQDFPSTFLVTNPTLEDVEHALGMRPTGQTAAAPEPVAAPSKPRLGRSITNQLQRVSAKLQQKDVSKCPPAQSVCLQGNPKTATKKLFLFPDGSGSATSYVPIPRLSSDVAVFGLNCPFMKTPQDWTNGVDGVAQLFVKEIQRRQPKGPYCVGGWSAGGVIAYEGVRQLIEMGETVERLILIDAPCPYMSKEPLPPGFHLFLDQIGLLGTGGSGSAPDWLLPHFASAIKSLSEYQPQAIPEELAPKTFAIWCRKGICPEPGDPRPPCVGPEPAPMTWLLDDRTDFGDNGWALLLGHKAMKYGVMDGNHFTMMKDELAVTLGELIKQGMGITT